MRLRLAALAALAPLAAACGSVVSPVPGNTLVSAGATGGDPTAGKVVYAHNACGSCHTFKPAASTGKVGPDLDQLASYAQKAGTPLVQYTTGAITNPPPAYVPPGFPKNAMPNTYGSTLSSKQLADLVAFLTSSS